MLKKRKKNRVALYCVAPARQMVTCLYRKRLSRSTHDPVIQSRSSSPFNLNSVYQSTNTVDSSRVYAPIISDGWAECSTWRMYMEPPANRASSSRCIVSPLLPPGPGPSLHCLSPRQTPQTYTTFSNYRLQLPAHLHLRALTPSSESRADSEPCIVGVLATSSSCP